MIEYTLDLSSKSTKQKSEHNHQAEIDRYETVRERSLCGSHLCIPNPALRLRWEGASFSAPLAGTLVVHALCFSELRFAFLASAVVREESRRATALPVCRASTVKRLRALN